jgi:hypothetical protein
MGAQSRTHRCGSTLVPDGPSANIWTTGFCCSDVVNLIGLFGRRSSPGTRGSIHSFEVHRRHRACGLCGKAASPQVGLLKACGRTVDGDCGQVGLPVDDPPLSTGRLSGRRGYQQVRGLSSTCCPPLVHRQASDTQNKCPQSYPQAVDDEGVWGTSASLPAGYGRPTAVDNTVDNIVDLGPVSGHQGLCSSRGCPLTG